MDIIQDEAESFWYQKRDQKRSGRRPRRCMLVKFRRCPPSPSSGRFAEGATRRRMPGKWLFGESSLGLTICFWHVVASPFALIGIIKLKGSGSNEVMN